MTRTQTRQLAFELLYSLEIQKVTKDELMEQIKLFLKGQEEINGTVRQYIIDVAQGIEKNEEEIQKLISQNLKEDWQLSRISKVNLAILKLAIYEMNYNKLPYKIAVNEAVELAKKYGEDTSPGFVNGILANIIKNLGLV